MRFDRLIAPLQRRVQLMVGRCILRAVNDDRKVQFVQVTMSEGEVREGERMQSYGFTSVPHPDCEGVAVAVGGNRNHLLVIASDDRRYRLKGLKSGEVALYDDLGQVVKLGRDGIEVESKGSIKVTAAEGAEIVATQGAKIQASAGVTIESVAGVSLRGASPLPEKGVVNGDCLCAFTGKPHPMVSIGVRATL